MLKVVALMILAGLLTWALGGSTGEVILSALTAPFKIIGLALVAYSIITSLCA